MYVGWAGLGSCESSAGETAAVESVVGAAADSVAAPELSAQSVPDPGPVQTSHRHIDWPDAYKHVHVTCDML